MSLDGLSDSEGHPVVLDRSLSQLVGLSISPNVHFSEQETIASHHRVALPRLEVSKHPNDAPARHVAECIVKDPVHPR